MGNENIESTGERERQDDLARDETAHDSSYWEKEKARLEAYKLRLESQNYEQRLRLEDEKLKSDVKDWYFRVMAALLTMIATGASFFIFHWQDLQELDGPEQAAVRADDGEGARGKRRFPQLRVR